MTLREKLAPAMTTIASVGSAIDLWSHNLDGKANLVNRHIVGTIPLVGNFLAEHSGNMFRSVAPIVFTTTLAESLRSKAQETDNKLLSQAANAVEFSGLLAVVAANLAAESFKDGKLFIAQNAQYWGDLGAGIGLMFVAYYGTKGIIDIYRRKKAISRSSENIKLAE